MTNVVKLLKNKKTGQIVEQSYKKETIFHRFKEHDYIQIGRLLWYNYDVGNNKNAMDINVTSNNVNALEIFTKKAQDYIKTGGGYIRLDNFNSGINDISETDFTQIINQWTNTNLNKLTNFRKSVGFLTKNLLYLNKIKENVIDLEEIFKELSIEFELSSENIESKNLNKFQIWRNRIILDTVNNFQYSKINKNFLAFIILHMFILCQDEFYIEEFEDVFDGGKMTFLLKNLIESNIKQIKNEIKKKRSRKTRSRKNLRSRSRKRRTRKSV
jgi:hypothetical protein